MLDTDSLRNKRIMVTGATGLIGKTLVKRLLSYDAEVVAVVRNIEYAKSIFGENDQIEFLVSDVREIPVRDYRLDYIIHGAAVTSSKEFVERPVDVIGIAFEGTKRILEVARCSDIRSFVYLSSMEVYGTPDSDEKIAEDHFNNINTMAVRSCYPESKRMCECLCRAYAGQYGLPCKIARLTQTFGPGVKYNDGRVFAEFARCVIEKRNIVLKTKGETKRSYLHVDDAVDAILYILLKGADGEAYNAANEDTYCSIYEMAKFVADTFSDDMDVIVDESENRPDLGYAPVLHMNLDTGKLRALGWEPVKDMHSMFSSLIDAMKQDQ